ncbi:hypothetical protein K402DRAFT_177697 [Aulographum hederae CBS 113979]|uniref:FHA domain-containing protein n=1 Tax=Aulographum hederae CBS 113979 TaxID=1176131 RepID=A0A6G1GQX6_9PEZI|nr:hypothetical protein K402DRAFT_177697 [Aulographum hederae CBS 113979]
MMLPGSDVRSPFSDPAAVAVAQNDSNAPDSQRNSLPAFAKLTFVEGEFLITTYAIVLGREGAEKKPKPRKSKKKRSTVSIQDSDSVVHTPLRATKGHGDAERRSQKSHAGSDVSKTPRAYAFAESLGYTKPGVVDLDRQREKIEPFPDPWFIPHIKINDQESGMRNVSREHLWLGFHFHQQAWVIHVLGINGVWLNDDLIHKGDVKPLNHGDIIQIGNWLCTFYLPKSGTEDTESAQAPSISRSSHVFEDSDGNPLHMSEESDDDDYGEFSVAPSVFALPPTLEEQADEVDVDDDEDEEKRMS